MNSWRKLVKINDTVGKIIAKVDFDNPNLKVYFTDGTYAELYSISNFDHDLRDVGEDIHG